jgi:hypothetical protein
VFFEHTVQPQVHFLLALASLLLVVIPSVAEDITGEWNGTIPSRRNCDQGCSKACATFGDRCAQNWTGRAYEGAVEAPIAAVHSITIPHSYWRS